VTEFTRDADNQSARSRYSRGGNHDSQPPNDADPPPRRLRLDSNGGVHSREVSCTAVYQSIAPTLLNVREWPTCGTPAWAALDDGDPRKLAGLFHAALNWAITEDLRQGAEHEAAQAISAAADWSDIANELKGIREFYAARPWLKRVVA